MTALQRFAAWLNARVNPPRDPNMRLAFDAGNVFCDRAEAKLAPKLIAELVDRIDPAMPDLYYADVKEDFRRWCFIGGATKSYWPKLYETDRIGLALRLWSGCIVGAKLIAYRTRSGVNRERRARLAELKSSAWWQDPVWREGFRAALLFKRLREQRVLLEGLPAGLFAER